MLTIKDLNVYYGAIHALRDVSLSIAEGEIVSLIGSNGAGKSTLLKTISGLLPQKSGSIRFEESEIINTRPSKIVARGCTHVPEGRHIFKGMSVKENLMLGAYSRPRGSDIQSDIKAMYSRFDILKQRSNQDASTLSGGEQQMLAIARALMAHPRLLLLDEPSMGLAPLMVKEIFDIVKSINQDGMTVLLVEQNAKMALSIANRGYVLETGSVVLEGQGSELMNSKEIQRVYLGG